MVHANHKTTRDQIMDAINNNICSELEMGTPARCPVHLRKFFRGPPDQILQKNALDCRLWLKTAQGVWHMVTTLLVNHDDLSAERQLI